MGTINIAILQKLKLEPLGNLPVVIHLLKILFWIQKSTIWSLTLAAQSFQWERKRNKELWFCVVSTRVEARSERRRNAGHLTQPRRGEGVRATSQ